MFVADSGEQNLPAILLVHGGGVAGWMWSAEVARLRSRYRTIVPDLPGHDRSSDVPFTTIPRIADALADLLGDERASVVGFSLGAQIALQLASTRPDLVERVTVVSALAEGAPLPRANRALVSAAAPLARRTWFARLQARSLFVPEALADDYVRTSRLLSREDLLALTDANAAFRTPEGWPAFPGPSLLMMGEREPRALRDGMRRLHAAQPRSRLVVHESAGHGIALQHPDWFHERIDEWLGA
ncbi:alpha/beta fold hydrolase [Microbacterium sp. gxy059]|uniref:alpha/beta fold hydrolase n=1 Tax=Microbacterium sp. gxy059 TaxID=2957199 RepID=UPI003D9A08B4